MQQKEFKNLPLKNVVINDNFWNKYTKLVPDVILPYQWKLINDNVEGATKSYCIENFKIAAKEAQGEHRGMVFQDTDLAKWLEAVGFSLASNPDPELEKVADDVIELVGRAQQEDGYLNTYYSLSTTEKRWSNLFEGHELYTAGHFIEAAVAYFRATEKTRLLDIASKFADYICDYFGPKEQGKVPGYPGHQEIELALIKLYDITKKQQYLDTAYFFINQRGVSPQYFFEEPGMKTGRYLFPEFADFELDYCQAHLPVNDQAEAVGHAVRGVYMYSAMAELAYKMSDEKLFKTCERLYNNIVNKRMYITGSIGSASYGERFTTDYDLPNDHNYSETCATIGLAMFAARMFKITGDSKYMDTVETALYNTLLSGISMDGRHFFYVNPLEVVPEIVEKNPTYRHVEDQRQKWFKVACCPTNISRTLASMSDYAYNESNDTLFVNLYISGRVSNTENNLSLKIDTQYPNKEKINITVDSSNNYTGAIALRIPGFSPKYAIMVNGEKIKESPTKGYVYIKREWVEGDTIDLTLDLTPKFVYANQQIRCNIGKTALTKGPVVYCFEEVDNTSYLASAVVDTDKGIAEENTDILGGLTLLKVHGSVIDYNKIDPDAPLYTEKPVITRKEIDLKAIPYFAWNNRGRGEMTVWIDYK